MGFPVAETCRLMVCVGSTEMNSWLRIFGADGTALVPESSRLRELMVPEFELFTSLIVIVQTPCDVSPQLRTVRKEKLMLLASMLRGRVSMLLVPDGDVMDICRSPGWL